MSAIIKSFSFLQYFVGNWFRFLCAVQLTCEDVISLNSTYQTTGYDRPVKFVTILLFFFYDRPDSVVTKARKQKSWRVELFLESDGILKESDRIHDCNLKIPTVWLLDLGCNPIVSWKQTFINSKNFGNQLIKSNLLDSEILYSGFIEISLFPYNGTSFTGRVNSKIPIMHSEFQFFYPELHKYIFIFERVLKYLLSKLPSGSNISSFMSNLSLTTFS
jgi:hypothetical protein